jgi:D-sedoheptulose 7-phosphate isomerase
MTIPEVFADHSAVTARAALELPPVLERAVATMHEALRAGGKILACGNGGSAADAQHLSAELVGRFRDERQALAAIALTADTALLTALGNDYGYERVFARQVEGLAQRGDVLMAFSTSGNSPNVVQAAQTARRLGCTVIAFTGARGGELAGHADVLLKAPSNTVARIQEVHSLCIHVLCEALDALIRAERPS